METSVQIPRLARGSFTPDSGVGCIMNLMCWTKKIEPLYVNDEPAGYWEPFRDALISLNDTMCIDHGVLELAIEHGAYTTTNCAACSRRLLDWAFALDETEFIDEDKRLLKANERSKISRLLREIDSNRHSIASTVATASNSAFDRKTFRKDLREIRRADVMKELAETYGHWKDNWTIADVYNQWERTADEMSENEYHYVNKAFRAEYDRHIAGIDKKMNELIDYVDHLRGKYVPKKRMTQEDFEKGLDKTFFDYGINVPEQTKEKV